MNGGGGVAQIKKQLKSLAIGRRFLPTDSGWELREETSAFNAFSGSQKVDMDPENTYYWKDIETLSIT